ncbi:MFS transporter [Arthrobacter sp. NPDC058097]|uniref:MFS transporter n=1 Tax=Arthrobacter sp. NPDC058097 TaxID=3346340 RepID=UPI0036DBB4AB
MYGAIGGGGSAIGLIVGGVLTEYASWRWTLFVNVPIALVTAATAVRVLRESKAAGETKYDIPGVLASAARLAALVYGFTKANTDGWGAPTTLALLLGGIGLLVLFVLIERRASHPLLPLRVVLHRNRGGSYLGSLLMGVGMFGVFLFLTYYLQQILGYTALESGLAFLPFTAAVVLGATISGRLLPRVGPRVLMSAGFAIAAGGLVLSSRFELDSSYVWQVVPAEVVTAAGLGLFFGPLASTALTGVANRDAGVASALVNTTQQIGGALGTAILVGFATSVTTGYVATNSVTTDGYTSAFALSAGILAVAAVMIGLLIQGKRPAAKDSAAAGRPAT